LWNDTGYREISPDRKSLLPALAASAEERRDVIAYLSSRSGVNADPQTREWAPIASTAFQQIVQPTPGDWPTYNGDLRGNRHSSLDQINAHNVGRLRLQWSYTLPNDGIQTTPVVAGGVMYVSSPNRVAALDSRTGREIWNFVYSRLEGAAVPRASEGGGGVNRGVAILGDRV